MKIEQLLPYMPHGLQIKILNHKCDYVGIEYSVANGYYMIGDRLHITYNGGSTGKDIDTFKPILRPMSDLAKIEWGEYAKELDLCYENSLGWGSDLEIDGHTSFWGLKGNYSIFESLFENHFDIFGLIEQNLAISIHDLEK